MTHEGWRPVRLATIVQAEQRGWEWLSYPPAGPHGKALRSRRGAIYQVKMLPLSVRRYEERRFKDA